MLNISVDSHDQVVQERDELKISSVQLLSRVQILVIPWTAAHQASLSITNSWNLLKLMSIESVMLGEGQIGILHTVSSQVFC